MSTGTPTPLKTSQVSYLRWKFVTATLNVAFYLAVVALLGDVTIWGLSFASPHVVMPEWIIAPFFVAAIVLNGVAVISWVSSHPGRGGRMPIDLQRVLALPLIAKVMLVGLAIAVIVTGPIELFTQLSGQPGYNAATHQYYFDNHGAITITTRAHYLAGVAIGIRGFLGFAMFFTFFAVSNLTEQRQTRRRITVTPFARITPPRSHAPRGSIRPLFGVILLVISSGIAFTGAKGIISRVDRYLRSPTSVTTSGITQYLSSGPHVVFVFCETNSIDANYACPEMNPGDIAISELASNAEIRTQFDLSVDHISPRNLPAAGQLVFVVPTSGKYRLRLTRPIVKEVFVAVSPGVVARAAVGSVVETLIGLLGFVVVIVMLVRRLRWRVSSASPVPLNPSTPLTDWAGDTQTWIPKQ